MDRWKEGYNYCDKKWKEKIKDKIEELNDLNSEFSQRVIKSKECYLTELVQNILREFL